MNIGEVMKIKYKLTITISIFKSKTTVQKIHRNFVWDNKDDAINCKKLLEKAEYSNNTAINFFEFGEKEII